MITDKKRAYNHAYAVAHKSEKKDYNRKYREKNLERLLEYGRNRHAENRVQNNIKRRKWYRDHRDYVLAKAKEDHIKNREKRKAYHKAYFERNKAAISEYKKQWVANNRAHVNAKNAEYAKLNPEKHRKWNKNWRKKNPAKVKAQLSKRRDFEKNAVKDMKSVEQFYLNIEYQEVLSCSYCGKFISRRDVRVDHIVPISRGGHHTADNLAIACHWCNTSKNDNLLSEWPRCPELLKDI